MERLYKRGRIVIGLEVKLPFLRGWKEAGGKGSLSFLFRKIPKEGGWQHMGARKGTILSSYLAAFCVVWKERRQSK